jgi:hypothetical protein
MALLASMNIFYHHGVFKKSDHPTPANGAVVTNGTITD